ncbi:MAG: hypothetical protein ACOCWA_06525 [Bacteroidota bacterium]
MRLLFLEKAWTRKLEKLALAKSEYKQYQVKRNPESPAHKKLQIARLAKEMPTPWKKTTNLIDKKRIV